MAEHPDYNEDDELLTAGRSYGMSEPLMRNLHNSWVMEIKRKFKDKNPTTADLWEHLFIIRCTRYYFDDENIIVVDSPGEFLRAVVHYHSTRWIVQEGTPVKPACVRLKRGWFRKYHLYFVSTTENTIIYKERV